MAVFPLARAIARPATDDARASNWSGATARIPESVARRCANCAWRVSPSRSRHPCCAIRLPRTCCRRAFVDIRTVQELLGHADVRHHRCIDLHPCVEQGWAWHPGPLDAL